MEFEVPCPNCEFERTVKVNTGLAQDGDEHHDAVECSNCDYVFVLRTKVRAELTVLRTSEPAEIEETLNYLCTDCEHSWDAPSKGVQTCPKCHSMKVWVPGFIFTKQESDAAMKRFLDEPAVFSPRPAPSDSQHLGVGAAVVNSPLPPIPPAFQRQPNAMVELKCDHPTCGHQWLLKEPLCGWHTVRCPRCTKNITDSMWENRRALPFRPTA